MSPIGGTVQEIYKIDPIYKYISSLVYSQYSTTQHLVTEYSHQSYHFIPTMPLLPPKQRDNHYDPHVDEYWGDFPAIDHLTDPTSTFRFVHFNIMESDTRRRIIWNPLLQNLSNTTRTSNLRLQALMNIIWIWRNRGSTRGSIKQLDE